MVAGIVLLGTALFLAALPGGPHGRAVVVNLTQGELHVRMWTAKEGEEPEADDLAWEGEIPANNPIEAPFKIVTPGYLRIEFRRENMSEPAVWEEYMIPTYVRRYFYAVGRKKNPVTLPAVGWLPITGGIAHRRQGYAIRVSLAWPDALAWRMLEGLPR